MKRQVEPIRSCLVDCVHTTRPAVTLKKILVQCPLFANQDFPIWNGCSAMSSPGVLSVLLRANLCRVSSDDERIRDYRDKRFALSLSPISVSRLICADLRKRFLRISISAIFGDHEKSAIFSASFIHPYRRKGSAF